MIGSNVYNEVSLSHHVTE